jgi:hypothetical protein
MESLNKLRVGLKHSGNLPHPQTVRSLLPRAKGFFENVLSSYCQLSYRDVSLIDLIPDQDVRAVLSGAREKFDTGDRPSAMQDLKIAFHKLENPDGRYLPKLCAPNKPSLPDEMIREGWGEYLGRLHTFLDQTANVTNALLLGIDPGRYANFVSTSPGVQWSMSKVPFFHHWSRYEDVSPESFDELVSFLIDYSLKVSEAYIQLAPDSWDALDA